MKNTLASIAALALTSIVGFSSNSLQAEMVEKNAFNFPTPVAELSSGNISYHYYLSEKDRPSELQKKDALYAQVVDALGMKDDSGDKLYALIVRNVYVISRSMDRYVRSEVLNDLNYLRFVIDATDMRRLSSTEFEVPRRGNSPGFKMNRDLLVSANQVERNLGAKLSKLPLKSLEGDIPFTVQDSYEFSKVLGQNTSKQSRMITAYYPISDSSFLVDSYILSHLYNVPPGFMGGTKRLKEDFLKAVEGSIQRGQFFKP